MALQKRIVVGRAVSVASLLEESKSSSEIENESPKHNDEISESSSEIKHFVEGNSTSSENCDAKGAENSTDSMNKNTPDTHGDQGFVQSDTNGTLNVGDKDAAEESIGESSSRCQNEDDIYEVEIVEDLEDEADPAQYANALDSDELGSTEGDSNGTESACDVNEAPNVSLTFDCKSVFITGVTGFVGKLLLEKLLRSCTGITNIFVLLREKGKNDADTRLRELLQSPAFDRIREECPASLNKVVAISGNILCSRLGLSDDDLKTLKQLVSFVFHCAGVTDYYEDYRNALATNLLGTKHILEVCHTMETLSSLVYLSSAYSFSYLRDINDAVYLGMQQPDYYLTCLDIMTNKELECVCKRDNMTSNVYHFSKALCERLLVTYQGDLPISVVRPSLISSSWKEPLPGFIDTVYGSSGLLLSCASGLVWSVFAKSHLQANLVPVDIVVNTLIVAAHHLVLHKPGRVFVVNCTASDTNLLTWGQLHKICAPLYNMYPSITIPSCPGGSFKNYRWGHQISVLFQHWLPAYLANLFWWIRRRRPSEFFRVAGQSSRDWVNMYSLLHAVLSHLEFATTERTSFCYYRRHALKDELSEDDKQVFYTDPSTLEWEPYLDNYILGLRRYVKRESDSTLKDAQLRLTKHRDIWSSVRLFTMVAAGYFVRKALANVSVKTIGNVMIQKAATIPSHCLNIIRRS